MACWTTLGCLMSSASSWQQHWSSYKPVQQQQQQRQQQGMS
jgi:hypothetical protein